MNDSGVGKIPAATPESNRGGEIYSTDALIADIQEASPSLVTGYENLDKSGVVFPNQAVTAIVAPPRHGKTALLLNLLVTLVKMNPERAFVYVSYKDPRARLALKLVHKESGVNLGTGDNEVASLEQYIRFQGLAAAQDEGHVATALNDFGKWTDSARLTLTKNDLPVEQLENRLSEIASRLPLGAVFVDYFQAVHTKERFQTMREKDEYVALTLRDIAQRLHVPVIVGARMIRAATQRPFYDLSELDEIRGLELVSQCVLSLFNASAAGTLAEEESRSTESEPLTVSILKNEAGVTGPPARLSLKPAKMMIMNAGDMR